MSLMAFLFPEVEAARLRALARLDGMWREMDEREERLAPMRAVAKRVMPLLKDGRPARIVLPSADYQACLDGLRELFPDATGHDFRLFGVPVEVGDEMKTVA